MLIENKDCWLTNRRLKALSQYRHNFKRYCKKYSKVACLFALRRTCFPEPFDGRKAGTRRGGTQRVQAQEQRRVSIHPLTPLALLRSWQTHIPITHICVDVVRHHVSGAASTNDATGFFLCVTCLAQNLKRHRREADTHAPSHMHT